ncbi:cyclase family protein [Selenomonas sp. oral taxon 138]|uniref:cyclase family protein n=1 Tax=Selenomonas sp. oral taxon 138 TaxID=712532 RepID=UPI0002A2D24F|nr:cyclase family protein [Selenomonas sp. oral taxon 138]EKX95792.1 putative cyclase [Selenomonas sp. oral taxon 138 str. F0429]
MAYHLWSVLDELKSDAYEWVDLTHPLNNDSPYWAGIPEGSVELSKTCFDWGNPMLDCLIQTFKFPGQFGTHIDFPGHFVRNRPLAESYGAQHMLYPLCVIDVTEQVARDVHYAVTVEDIKAYEAKYGAIPDGAFVALYTGWSKHWPDMDAISGTAKDGSENFPGWSMDALKYIYETRNAAASGHETLDTDASVEAAKAGDLACERYILDKGKLQVEVLTNLDRIAPAGALLFVAWPNIEGATGLPARVIAITPKK